MIMRKLFKIQFHIHVLSTVRIPMHYPVVNYKKEVSLKLSQKINSRIKVSYFTYLAHLLHLNLSFEKSLKLKVTEANLTRL